MAGTVHRFYLPAPLPPGESVALTEEQARQAARVLRLAPGAPVVLFNGDGQEVPGTIEDCAPRRVTVRLGEPRAGRSCPVPAIHLAQALIKADRFDWVVQKATELGVARITPLATSRTVVSLPVERARQRRERWQRIAVEAAEQSGRVTIPEIDEPATLDDLLPLMARIPALVCWENEAMPLHRVRLPTAGPLLVVIGPEGGFTREEIAAAVDAGARTVSLGPLILRSETAALAALAGIFTLAAAAADNSKAHVEVVVHDCHPTPLHRRPRPARRDR